MGEAHNKAKQAAQQTQSSSSGKKPRDKSRTRSQHSQQSTHYQHRQQPGAFKAPFANQQNQVKWDDVDQKRARQIQQIKSASSSKSSVKQFPLIQPSHSSH
uniref:Uncharacterized protein n=1 Tax=Romanomermis culicivorax TaxID=13658 RepID=A0A915KQV8_ROMCU